MLELDIDSDEDWGGLRQGELPQLLHNLHGLRSLLIEIADTHTIPAFGAALGNLPNLHILSISHDQQEEYVPDTYLQLDNELCAAICALPRLLMLSLTECHLPANISMLRRRAHLEHLYLVDCLLNTGSLTWLLPADIHS